MPRGSMRGGGGSRYGSLRGGGGGSGGAGRAYSPSYAAPRRPEPSELEHDDMYEWVIVFGGTQADVQYLQHRPPEENPYLVLQEAFERLRFTEAQREQVLRTDLRTSADGREVYLRVGACDDYGLMHEAEERGFLKRVIDLEDDAQDEYGDAGAPRRKHPKQLSEDGWTTNCDQEWGRIVGYAPFTKGESDEHLKWFEDPVHMSTEESEFYPTERFFNSGERQRLVKSLMNGVLWQNEVSKFGRECKYGSQYEYLFSTTMAGGPGGRPMDTTDHPEGGPAARSEAGRPQRLYLKDIYPLHCESEREWLRSQWTSPASFTSPLPLDPIRRYFGTSIGLYFAWLELYTRALIFPAVLGGLIWVVQYATGAASLNEMGDWLVAYSVFVALWSTMFLELWKRKESALRHDWGTAEAYQPVDYYEDVRPLRRGQPVAEEGAAKWELMGASAGMLLAISVALCVIAAIPLWIKAAGSYIADQACPDPGSLDGTEQAPVPMDGADHHCPAIPELSTWLSYGGSFFNLVCIVLLAPICERVVRNLTEHEQHRTHSEHATALIVKGFTLQFVLHYFVLFYIAFFKDGEFLGTPDSCGTVNEAVPGGGEAGVPDCVNDLGTQIFVVFVVKSFCQQLWEILAPKVRYCWRQISQGELAEGAEEAPGGVNVSGLERFEEQHLWDNPEDEGGTYTYDNYAEMCVQFGFVAIFAVAYPLGAAFALLNNLLEMRVDGHVLLTMTRRPRYVEASTIGSWMSVLQCLSVVAVITNSMMVGFTSTVLVHDIDLFSHISDRYQEAGLWVCVMAMEHLLLLAKVLLAMFVPDESQATRINKARLANFMDARQRERTELQRRQGDWEPSTSAISMSMDPAATAAALP